MRVTIVGSGDAFNAGGALHSCYLAQHKPGALMLECGPGVLAGMKRLGIPTEVPDTVLVSHLHGDHFGGIPFLLLEYTFMNPRDRPLQIAGPASIEERVLLLYQTLYRGMNQAREVPFPVEFIELAPGDRLELAGFDCEVFKVDHNADPYSLGYRLEGPEGSMLFSGDSAWTEAFVEKSRGVDLFLCECCSIDPVIPAHISYQELLSHRSRLECKRLLLTHLGADVREFDDFEFERATDGLVLELGCKS